MRRPCRSCASPALGPQDGGCAVGHDRARIGDARSTLADGIIRHLNPAAAALGVQAGAACRDVAARLRTTPGDKR